MRQSTQDFRTNKWPHKYKWGDPTPVLPHTLLCEVQAKISSVLRVSVKPGFFYLMGPVAKGKSEFSTDTYTKNNNNNKDPFKDQ